MPKNPFTGEEMRQDVYDFIIKHSNFIEDVRELSTKNVEDSFLVAVEIINRLDNGNLTIGDVKLLADDIVELEDEIEYEKNAVAFYEASLKRAQADAEYTAVDYDEEEYLENDEYKKLVGECEALGVSAELVKSSIEELYQSDDFWEDVESKSKTIGGKGGAVDHYYLAAITKANNNETLDPKQRKAIEKAIECAILITTKSEDQKYPGRAYYLKNDAMKKFEAAAKAYGEARGDDSSREPVDEESYESYTRKINQYEKINGLIANVKNSFAFPKKDGLSQAGRTDALNKYAEARDRADSHWGITKFFASLLPGIFSETAKDMADEKAWKEMLKGAEFTDEDLKNAGKQNAVVENPVNEAEEKHGTEIEDLDLSPRLSQDIKKNDIEVKVGVKQQESNLNNEKDKNKGNLQA